MTVWILRVVPVEHGVAVPIDNGVEVLQPGGVQSSLASLVNLDSLCSMLKL